MAQTPKRPRAEQLRAENARRREQEARRKQWLLVGLSVLAVFAVVGALVGIKLTGGSAAQPTAQTASGQVVNSVTAIPAAAFAQVDAASAALPKPVRGKPALTSNGKPEVLYLGAEFCPFCAAERWPLAAALSRFGTFSGLQETHSSPTDSPPSIPTLTFAKALYHSDFISFMPVETADVQGHPLQTPTNAQLALQRDITGGNGIPFIDIANRYYINAAGYDPSILEGKSFSQIAAAAHDPNSAIGKPILANANTITAAICNVTNDKPAKVCDSSGINVLQEKLGG